MAFAKIYTTMSLRALIVDDTVMYRKVIGDALAAFPDVEVVGTAGSGSIALKKLALTPADIVFLDVNMPDMDGIETLQRIRAEFPAVQVVMVSSLTVKGSETTIKALEMGAVDFIPKPEGTDFAASMHQLATNLLPVIRSVQMRLHRAGGALDVKTAAAKTASAKPALSSLLPARPAAPIVPVAPMPGSAPLPRSFGVVAIGVSTGGPEALNKLIPALQAKMPVPVVMVQHMPPLFTKSLADSLDKKSSIKVVEAAEGDILQAGTVYIAPGGRHMAVRRRDDGAVVVTLNDGPPENSCRPAVDVLFRSVASAYGDKGVLSVILTGMGSDGCNGVRALKRKGCLSITQAESTCVVYGMPRAVDEAGLSDKSMPLDEIAREISQRLGC